MGNDGGGAILQIISPSARTGFGVPSTGGGGTSTALTVASGADSMTVTSPISMPFTSAMAACRVLLLLFPCGPSAAFVAFRCAVG